MFPLIVREKQARVSEGRTCGSCTACCSTLSIPEHGLDKAEREPCRHLRADSSCGGCSIYDDRPEPCRTFCCLWLEGGLAGDERRRPDNLGLMFHWTVSAFGMHLMAWETRPGATEEPPAQWLLHQLQKKVLICVLLKDRGDQPGTRKFIGPAKDMARVARYAEEHLGTKPF